MCVCVSAVTPLESRLSPFPPLPSSTTRRTSLFLHSRHHLITFYTPPPLHASLSSPATPSLPSLRNSSRHLAPHAAILAHDSARLSLSLSLSPHSRQKFVIFYPSPLSTRLSDTCTLSHTCTLSALHASRAMHSRQSRRFALPLRRIHVYICIHKNVYTHMYILTSTCLHMYKCTSTIYSSDYICIYV